MQNLTTRVPFPKPPFQLDFESNILLFGSCFTANLGNRLKNQKFRVVNNPFGTTFNPLSIFNQLKRIVKEEMFDKDDFFFQDGLWKSFHLHSSFASTDLEKLMDSSNAALLDAKKHLTPASCLFITFGSAWAYQFLENEQVVNNCHKVPADQFKKFLISGEEIYNAWKNLIDVCPKLLELNIVFTISPVRHWKDGAEGNQRSKAELIRAVHQIKDPYDILYYPVYEFFIDELRDYRFYDTDLLHPSPVSLDLVWSRFFEDFIDTGIKPMCQRIEKLNKNLLHRPFFPGSDSYHQFLISIMNELNALEKFLPGRFENEKKDLEERLNSR